MNRSYRLLFGLGILLCVSAVAVAVASPAFLPLFTSDPIGSVFRLIDVSPAVFGETAATVSVVEATARNLAFAAIAVSAMLIVALSLFASRPNARPEVRGIRANLVSSAT